MFFSYGIGLKPYLHTIGNKRVNTQRRCSFIVEDLKETNEGTKQIIVVLFPHKRIAFVKKHTLMDVRVNV